MINAEYLNSTMVESGVALSVTVRKGKETLAQTSVCPECEHPHSLWNYLLLALNRSDYMLASADVEGFKEKLRKVEYVNNQSLFVAIA